MNDCARLGCWRSSTTTGSRLPRDGADPEPEACRRPGHCGVHRRTQHCPGECGRQAVIAGIGPHTSAETCIKATCIKWIHTHKVVTNRPCVRRSFLSRSFSHQSTHPVSRQQQLKKYIISHQRTFLKVFQKRLTWRFFFAPFFAKKF